MDPLPRGLSLCDVCGQPYGVVNDRGSKQHGYVSHCLCHGVECPTCGKRFFRPISHHYEPLTGKFWHVPYFVGVAIDWHRRQCAAAAAGDASR